MLREGQAGEGEREGGEGVSEGECGKWGGREAEIEGRIEREEDIERVGGKWREGERRERNAEVDLDQECTVQWRVHGVYIADIFLFRLAASIAITLTTILLSRLPLFRLTIEY